jgi:hypothetical protein
MTMTEPTISTGTATTVPVDLHRLRTALAAADPFRSTDTSRTVLTYFAVTVTPPSPTLSASAGTIVTVQATDSYAAARVTYTSHLPRPVEREVSFLVAADGSGARAAKLADFPLMAIPVQGLTSTSDPVDLYVEDDGLVELLGLPASRWAPGVTFPETDKLFSDARDREPVAPSPAAPWTFNPALLVKLEQSRKAAWKAAGVTPKNQRGDAVSLTNLAGDSRPARFTYTVAGLYVEALVMPVRVS